VTLYTPDFQTVASAESVYFDGSASSTDEAQVTEMSANFHARIYLERSNDDGSTYEEVTQFPTGVFDSSWHTRDIQPTLKAGTRRLRFDNVDDSEGVVEMIGEEL